MADEALVSGIEKLQVEGTQQTEKVNASEREKSIVPEKLQCDSSESGRDSGTEKEKDAALAKGDGEEEKKKKKKVLKKKKKKGTKKNEGEGSMADKLQCDSSDSKSGSGDDSSGSKSGSGDDSGNSKSGSGDDSKSESGCANEVLEGEVTKQEKKKGLIEKIREKLSRKPKNETAEVTNEEISETKKEDKQNLDKLQCDSSDSKSNSSADPGSESCSGKEKDAVLKGGPKGEKKKVLRKKMKKATKKIDGEASTADKLQCDSSDSKSGSGDDSSDSKSGDDSSGSKSGSKSGSGDDSSSSKSGSGDASKTESGFSSKKEKSEVKIANKEEEKKGEEGNQSSMAETEVPLDTKADEAKAVENLEVLKEMEKDQDEGKKVKEQGVDEQGAYEKKSILGKIMEKLPGYYKNGGE